ncbi:MAG: hypothetical protein MSH11_00600 [Ruminococcus sp.]|nr:hypothetical protein [Ruminococcus sp.]
MLNFKKLATIFCMISVIVMLTACESKTNNEDTTETTTTTTSINQSKSYADGLYIGDVIPNKKVAKEYGNLIMTNTLQKDLKDYKVVNVDFNNEKKLWIVNYSKDKMALGGDISIEISKKNGKVNYIEFGE